MTFSKITTNSHRIHVAGFIKRSQENRKLETQLAAETRIKLKSTALQILKIDGR
jgi:hypothetical protein